MKHDLEMNTNQNHKTKKSKSITDQQKIFQINRKRQIEIPKTKKQH